MPKFRITRCPYYDNRILHPVGAEVDIPESRLPPKGAVALDEAAKAMLAKAQKSEAEKLKERAEAMLKKASELENPKVAAPAAAPAPAEQTHGKRPSDRKVI